MNEPVSNSTPTSASPSGLHRVTVAVKREALSWFGVIGTILTLLNGIEDFVKLASWAQFLVHNFSAMTLWLWNTLLFFLPSVSPLFGWLLNLHGFPASRPE